MNVNRNYYEMQLEGHPLAPAEVEVSDRQLDRFRELVRRGKGRRDFDDDCFYEVLLCAGVASVPERRHMCDTHMHEMGECQCACRAVQIEVGICRAHFRGASSTATAFTPSTTAVPTPVTPSQRDPLLFEIAQHLVS